ncbi:MAG: HAD-IIB family hydrolase [Colwellia sp.]
MNKVKHIIYSDLDGTLLDHYTYQASAAMNVLKQLEKAEIPVILNTSKTFDELEIIHRELKLTTPFIIENGAAVYIPIGTFAKQPADTVIKGNYWVKSFCLPVQHWLDLLSKQAGKFSKHYQGFSSLSDSTLSELTGLTITEAKRAKKRQYGEPIQWLGNDSSKKEFVEHMLNQGANVVQGGRFLHVGDSCDKGQALLWLTKQYQEHYRTYFNRASVCTIALGDGENDIAMLEAANIAVQVKSPVHEFPTLHRQQRVTKTQLLGPEGWAEAIQKLLAKQLLSH